MSQTDGEAPFETTNHATIGDIRGLKRSEQVNQYLGVQYATLKDRFARAELVESYHQGGVLDATTFGPLPLMPPGAALGEQRLIQHELPIGNFSQSDIDCLTLNISVPSEKHAIDLPVFVYIHGGAFFLGSSSFPQNDLYRLVQLSVDSEKPIIAVGVNFRQNFPGFLTSETMRAAGYEPNNGLDDQRVALKWIKCHIAGFRGNPKKVTLAGHSAGAVAAFLHVHQREPLFEQMIALSGTALQRARPLHLLEKFYGMTLSGLGLGDVPQPEHVQKLLTVPMKDFTTKLGRSIAVGPVVDGHKIPEAASFDTINDKARFQGAFPGVEYCKRLMIGDCEMDTSIYVGRLAARSDILPKTLHECLSRTLGKVEPRTALEISRAYNLATDVSVNSFVSTRSCLEFGHDILFLLGNQCWAEAWHDFPTNGTEAYMYHFNCPNPWEGQWKGTSCHCQDVAFFTLNFNDFLSLGQRTAAKRFAHDICVFVHGEAPWPAFGKPGPGQRASAMVYDAGVDSSKDDCRVVSDADIRKKGRRPYLQQLVKREHYEMLLEAWNMFVAGPK